MINTNSNKLNVPKIVKAWVEANPLPTLLVTTDKLETLTANQAFAILLMQNNLRTADLLHGLSTESGSLDASIEESIAHLKQGDCIVRHLKVSQQHYYTVHLTKLELSTDSPLCLCCMIVPGGGESWDGEPTQFVSFEQNQRNYIEFVLECTDGKVSGKGGAAEILEMKSQTLFSKMKKLGIKR